MFNRQKTDPGRQQEAIGAAGIERRHAASSAPLFAALDCKWTERVLFQRELVLRRSSYLEALALVGAAQKLGLSRLRQVDHAGITAHHGQHLDSGTGRELGTRPVDTGVDAPAKFSQDRDAVNEATGLGIQRDVPEGEHRVFGLDLHFLEMLGVSAEHQAVWPRRVEPRRIEWVYLHIGVRRHVRSEGTVRRLAQRKTAKERRRQKQFVRVGGRSRQLDEAVNQPPLWQVGVELAPGLSFV